MTQTFCDRLIATAVSHHSKTAMTLLDAEGAENTTFGEMLARIRSLACRLTQEQIRYGDRVALLGENHPNWAIAYLGTLYRGAIVVPLDPSASVEMLARFIENSEAKLAFVSPASFEKFHAVCERLGKRIRAVALRPHESVNGFENFADWTRMKTTPEFDHAPPPGKPEDIALLMYTSGTTGTPKAVPLTHGNIFAESDSVQEAMQISDTEVILSLLPMFHAYAQIVNLWIATTIGARVVYITELNSEGIVRGLREGQVTTLTGVPRLWYLFHKKILDGVRAQSKSVQMIFSLLLALNGWLRDSLGVNAGRIFFRRVHAGFGGRLRLTVSAGSGFDASVARDYHRLGFTILQGYGLTETSGAATVTRFEDNKVGSVGTPLPGTQVKIDEPNGEGIGEVLIRGPIVMPGYYQNPEANQQAFTADGWFRSGDLGRFDRQGHLFIVGRKKDVIVLPSGKNVYPEDVEAQYSKSPLVGEICVLGVKDEAGDFAGAEKLCAVVVPDFEYLKSKQIVNAREMIRWELDGLGRELPEYQRVRDYIVRADPLPRTPTRKIQRFELKSQIEASGLVTKQARDAQQFVFTEADRALMDLPAGRALAAAIRQHAPDVETIHPQMNLELDLGLDSLARAECHVALEQSLGIEISTEAAAQALTVGEVITLAAQQLTPATNGFIHAATSSSGAVCWQQILRRSGENAPEIRAVLSARPVTRFFVWLILRLIYLLAKILFRLEVSGLENITRLQRPFLICPNHQSYLDAFLVSATYPRHILSQVFHVGWSHFFQGALSSRFARAVNVVPIDADTSLLRAMRAGAAGLRAGKILNIYPEGERSFDGLLHPFRKGAAILAAELNVPIVPVALDGAYRAWPRNSWRIRPAKIRIRFGAPIYADNVAVRDEGTYDALTERLKAEIQRLLNQNRQP